MLLRLMEIMWRTNSCHMSYNSITPINILHCLTITLSLHLEIWYGQLSAVVEPAAAVIGAAFVTIAEPSLPYALSFAAGAMIFVVVEEVIPESQRVGNTDLSALCLLFGFIVMTILDVALS